MSIQINNHKLIDMRKSFVEIEHRERNVGVNAEATTAATAGMMIATTLTHTKRK
jgi:hypothetical protein